eukprot:GEMP01041229.1.p1 GENE.GEMP01041229.1~~GEMP01041229.1.p1  ORF type:complete len:213 (+),score=34.30 GEMP01041229.1:693-1331(+)
MGETTLARQLHAFNYTDECDNVWHLLFSRLPQMALEDDWENTSPERQEVISFLNRHKKYDTILDALEKCDFCKTFLRYEFEDGEESQIPKLSLLPNLFFVLELLETHKIFMASSRPASILFTHLQSAVQRAPVIRSTRRRSLRSTFYPVSSISCPKCGRGIPYAAMGMRCTDLTSPFGKPVAAAMSGKRITTAWEVIEMTIFVVSAPFDQQR